MAKEIEVNVQSLKKDDDKQLPFEGTVKVKLKPYKDRLELAQKMTALIKSQDNQKLYEMMVGLVEENVTEIDIAMGDRKFDCLDELGFYKEGAELINRIASVVAEGPSLGN